MKFRLLQVLASILGFPQAADVRVSDGYHRPKTLGVMVAVNQQAMAAALRSLAGHLEKDDKR